MMKSPVTRDEKVPLSSLGHSAVHYEIQGYTETHSNALVYTRVHRGTQGLIRGP